MDDLKHKGAIVVDLLIGGFSKRLSIRPRRHAKYRVGNIYILFRVEICRLQDLIEHLAGAPDKWLSLDIFLRARRFADDQQPGVRIAAADDHVGPGIGKRVILHALQRVDHFFKGCETVCLLAEHVGLAHDRPPREVWECCEFYSY